MKVEKGQMEEQKWSLLADEIEDEQLKVGGKIVVVKEEQEPTFVPKGFHPSSWHFEESG